MKQEGMKQMRTLPHRSSQPVHECGVVGALIGRPTHENVCGVWSMSMNEE
jgi:hypothetical protein